MRQSLLAALLALAPALASALPEGRFDGDRSRSAAPPEAAAPAAVAVRAIDTDPRLWVVVPAPGKAQRDAIVGAGVSIEEVAPGQVGGFATPAAVAELKRLGFAVTAVPVSERFGPKDFPKDDAAFHNYAETVAELKAIAAASQGLAKVFSIGKSLQGRDVPGLRLNTSQGAAADKKPGIVFMGNHHAREHLSNEVPLLLAKYLVENRAKPEIAALLAERDVYVIPMVNPDGVEYDLAGDRYHMHRKNTRANGDGSVGVDLNRNYGWHWAEGGSSNDPGSDIYHGPAPFSEPETKNVKAFVESRKNLKVLLSFHTFSELILYPWGHSDDPIPDAKALAAYKAMAKTMAGMNGYTPQQSSELYIASGDTTDWSWGAHGIFSFTFELTPKSMWGGGFYPGAAAIASTFQANLRPALYLIGLADDPYRAAETTLAGAAAPPAGGR